jgi:adenylate cyclase, class 2
LGTEIEIKIAIGNADAFGLQLQELGARLLSSRHFEDNHIWDFPDDRLQKHQELIRIRIVDGRGVMTYKGPPLPEGIFKIREELETKIGSADIALQILARLGMKVRFRYQKYRREYEIDKVIVSIDETPIGNYAELEGSEASILNLARKMGIDSLEFLRASYYSLYVEYCEQSGVAPGFMVFK